jgi:predicted deacylase
LTKESLKIGKLVCEAGSKKTGWLDVLETPTSDVQMPLMIVNGEAPGSVLCLTAGVHGCEYPGIVASLRIFKMTDPKKLNGALVIVPVVNTPSFNMKTPFVCPIDNININRIAPGNPNGSASYLIANTLFTEVMPNCDYHIDLHSGDVTENVATLAIVTKTGNKDVDTFSEMLAKVYNLEYVLISDYSPGSISAEVSKLGKPSITAEVGGMGILDEKDVSLHMEGIINVMKQLKMIAGAPKLRSDQKALSTIVPIRAKHGGIFISKIKTGEKILQGQVLGEIINTFGDAVETVSSPADGVVILTSVPPSVNSGDTLMMLSKFTDRME